MRAVDTSRSTEDRSFRDLLTKPRTPRQRLAAERSARMIAQAAGIGLVTVVTLIIAFMARESLPLLLRVNIWDYLTGTHWYPVSEPPTFQILPFIVASFWVTVFSLLIALPLGLATAVYMAEMAPPRIAQIMRPIIGVLGGIPSIIYGLIGLLIVAPAVRNLLNLNTGLTGLTASLLLAVMVLPTIVSLSSEALMAVPRDYRDASLALGATQWKTLVRVTVPAASSGIKAAGLLALGRALGETMLVLMVAGGRISVPTGITQPMRTMTATLATEVNNAVINSDHYRALFGIGFVLLVVTLTISVLAERYAQKSRRQYGLGAGGGAAIARPKGGK